MIKLPIYRVMKSSPQVLQALGGPEPRFYPAGENDDLPVTYPYAVYQIVGGSPHNFLGQRPDLDDVLVQVDVYGTSHAQAEAVVLVLRDALEPHCRITSWRGASRDPETKSHRQSFDVAWAQPRA